MYPESRLLQLESYHKFSPCGRILKLTKLSNLDQLLSHIDSASPPDSTVLLSLNTRWNLVPGVAVVAWQHFPAWDWLFVVDEHNKIEDKTEAVLRAPLSLADTPAVLVFLELLTYWHQVVSPFCHPCFKILMFCQNPSHFARGRPFPLDVSSSQICLILQKLHNNVASFGAKAQVSHC